jgi:L-asparaginase II
VSIENNDVLAEIVRSGFVEGCHRGSVVVLAATGEIVASVGAIDEPMFPRSTNKPLQAVGMVRAGLRLGSPELALGAASHSGEPVHVERVCAMLAAGGLTEADLACPPELPRDPVAAAAVLAEGGGATRVTMECSGKHAAMLRTCRAAGWPVGGYTAAEHALQVAIRAAVAELAGEVVTATGVDGCGAPVFALTLRGLALAYSRLVDGPSGSAERQVADAMRAHPGLVGGSGRDVTRLMSGVPGLLAKDGAEGVYAAAIPGVGAVALKITDGAARPRVPVLVSALRKLGVDGEALDLLAESPVLGGGVPVGSVRATW